MKRKCRETNIVRELLWNQWTKVKKQGKGENAIMRRRRRRRGQRARGGAEKKEGGEEEG